MIRKSDLVVLICHGPKQTPTVYVPLVESLQTVGFEAYCPRLPLGTLDSSVKNLSLGDVNDPILDVRSEKDTYCEEDEVNVIFSELVSLVMKQSKRVLLVTHSTRSRVATHAAKEGLREPIRRQWGLIGGVIGIFCMAFEIPKVETIQTFPMAARSDAEVIPGLFSVWKNGTAGQSTASRDDEQQTDAGISQHGELGRAPATASCSNESMKLMHAAYSPLPCAYLFLEDRKRLSTDSHGSGDSTMYRCPPGPPPHSSWTKDTVENVISFSNKLSNDQGSWS
ncbi:hypothetical protein F5Y18DRAFT_257500 [Xylariaceae sp. FL1019]|nr:hypothetical protein F5Y18DRAFT_257500 [Xylariaceae sp. FL1019]